MFPSLHDIRHACPRTMGGLKALLLVDPLDLQAQPSAQALTVADLQFKAGKRPYVFQQDRLSGSLVGDQETGNAAGDFFNWRLNATVRNIRPDVERLRMNLMNRRIHVLSTYQDGFQRFVPWMRLAAGDGSGTKPGDRNGYTFSGACRTIIPTPALASSLSPEPDPGGGGSTGSTMTITTSNPTYTVAVPAGKLLKCLAVNASTAEVISLGTTAGGNDLLEDIPVMPPGSAGWPVVGENLLYTPVEKDIYFSGLSGTNTIILFFETVS